MQRVSVKIIRDFHERFGVRQAGRVLRVSPKTAGQWLARGVCVPADAIPSADRLLTRPLQYPMRGYSMVGRVWDGGAVVILGCGPSLTQAQVDYVRGKAHIIAVNDSYRLAPWADVIYFADERWHAWHKARPEFVALNGPIVTLENAQIVRADARVHSLHTGADGGLSCSPETLNTGGNSVYQALNFAALAGAKKVILLGVDMRSDSGRTHWHAGHPTKTHTAVYKRIFIPAFEAVAEMVRTSGVEVINASPGTALKCFKLMEISECL